jgi:hypothetical protein
MPAPIMLTSGFPFPFKSFVPSVSYTFMVKHNKNPASGACFGDLFFMESYQSF